MQPRSRRIVGIAALVIGIPLALLLTAFALAQTAPGKRLLAGLIENLASSPEQKVEVDGIGGLVPFDVSVGKLTVSDSRGAWLSADAVTLDWSPLAMLGGRLKISRLDAAAIEIVRQPVPGPKKRSTDDGAGSGLPRRVDIDAVHVDKLTLGSEIAGERAQWRLNGGVRVAGLDEDNLLTLKAERIDGGDGFLDLQARYEGAREYLTIKLQASESAATIQRYSPLQPKQGISMQADIAGPLNDLNGTLKVDAGDMLQVDGKVRAERRGNATQTTLTLTGRVGDLGDGPVLDAVRGDWKLTADGAFDAIAVTLRQSELSSPLGRLAGSGRIDRRDDTGDLTFTASARNAAFAKILPDIAWQSLTAEGGLTGKLMQPTVKATLAGEGLAIGEVKIGTTNAQIESAKPADKARIADLKARLDGIVLPAAGERSLTTEATVTAKLAVPDKAPIEVQAFDLVSPVLTAQGAGTYDPRDNLANGTLTLVADDLSVFADALNLKIAGKLNLKLQAEQSGKQQLAVTLDGTLQNGQLPQVPAPLLQPQLNASLRGTVAADQAWSIKSLRLESGAGTLVAQGDGTGETGQAKVEWTLNDMAALDAQLAGKTTGTVRLSRAADGLNIDLDGRLSDARVGAAGIPQLSIDLKAKRTDGETAGTLTVDGQMQDAPIKGGGDFAIADDGRARARDFDLRWASISVVGQNFALGPAGTTGDLKINAGNLQQLNPFLPVKLAGSLNATLKAVEGNKVRIDGAAQNLRVGAGVALDRAQIEGEIADPFERAAFDLKASASGSKLGGPLRQLSVKANGALADFAFNAEGSGEKLRIAAQGRGAVSGAQETVSLQSLNAVYSGQSVTLASPTRISVQGETVSVDRAVLRAGSGSVAISGRMGPNSNLEVQGRGLPLQLVKAFDPELELYGAANFTATVTGSPNNPKVDFTVDANDLRMRTIRTAGIPPGALDVKGTVQNGAATFEGRFSAGEGNRLNFSGTGPLPGAGVVDQGRLRLEGGLRLAQLTPFLGGNGRLNGRLAIDLTLTATNGNIGGDGTVRIVDGRYFNLDQGISIRDLEATFAVAGDRLEVQSFSAKPREGEVNLTGYIRIDPQLTLPVDLNIVARSARVLDRRDMQATLSTNLHLTGSVAQGMTLEGKTTVERAMINIGGNGKDGPKIVNLEVREINKPGGGTDDKPRRARLPGPEVRLAIDVDAPRNVLVQGRGLDVELGGQLKVGGTLGGPQIEGALQVRRGTFSGAGRRLEFTRGAVTFPDPNKLEPVFDFTATAKIEGGTAEIGISGTADTPKVTLSSSPSLPQDEIMARLLFGQSTSQLSALQLAEIASSVGTLSGLTGSSGGFMENIRKALGLDRLGVSSDPDAAAAGSSPLGGSSLEVGRNVAPGVYIGAKQGATSGSSSAVVEIELTPHIKVESEVGTDARSKVGVSVEWDY